MFKSSKSLLLVGVIMLTGCQQTVWKPQDKALWTKANELAHKHILIDTHMDVPYQLEKKMEDISEETSGDFDYPRAVKGGLDVAFIAVYVSPKYEDNGAKKYCNKTIDMLENIAASHPDKFTIGYKPKDVTDQFGKNKVSIVLAMENGAPIEGDLNNLKHFYDRGIRYITLTHSKCNHICDSSYDDERVWNGLSPFGKELVTAMNQMGMIIDISHVSDEAFYQVMELSTKPVIASHSSCRHFTPGMERNMDDKMIELMAANGGIIQISFGAMFVNTDVARKSKERWDAMDAHIAKHKLQGNDKDEYVKKYKKAHPVGRARVSDVVNHIDHVVKLAGIEHVGLGSDFDGVGDAVPIGLEDVSCYPNLIYELLKRGYTEEDIEKICGGNFLRVWSQIQSAK